MPEPHEEFLLPLDPGDKGLSRDLSKSHNRSVTSCFSDTQSSLYWYVMPMANVG